MKSFTISEQSSLSKVSSIEFAYGWKIVSSSTRLTLVHPDGFEQCLGATKDGCSDILKC